MHSVIDLNCERCSRLFHGVIYNNVFISTESYAVRCVFCNDINFLENITNYSTNLPEENLSKVHIVRKIN
jgi:hypothetical protein